ncbi:hypothetical protein HDU67_003411 [Dinochytrium kinnereticum]|nr:hypothetical protein HDU67_003411 [Dinochytrium kinnereticum]
MLSAFPAIDLTSDLCCVIFPTVNYGLLMTCTVWIAKFMSDGNRESLENVKCCLDAFDNLRGLLHGASKGWRIVTEYLQMKGIRLPSEDEKGTEPDGASPSVHPSPRQSRIPMDSLLNGTRVPTTNVQDLVIGSDPSVILGSNAPLLGLDLGMWWDGTNLFDLAGLGGLISDTATMTSTSSATPDQIRFPDSSPPIQTANGPGFVLNGFGAPVPRSPMDAVGPGQMQGPLSGYPIGYPGQAATTLAPALHPNYVHPQPTNMGHPPFGPGQTPQGSYFRPANNNQWGYMK